MLQEIASPLLMLDHIYEDALIIGFGSIYFSGCRGGVCLVLCHRMVCWAQLSFIPTAQYLRASSLC